MGACGMQARSAPIGLGGGWVKVDGGDDFVKELAGPVGIRVCSAGEEFFPRVSFVVTNLRRFEGDVVKFYNGRGRAEQWIKEGKLALHWTRLSCHDFVDNQVRLQLFVLAYNLGNFLRRLASPNGVKHWSLTTLREKLIKIGAKVVTHARYVVFQMAEVAVPRRLFRAILERIRRLKPPETVPR